MKLNKMICIDQKFFELLKEKNASEIINRLLEDYFGSGEGIEDRELEKRIYEIEQEIREKEKQIKEKEFALNSLKDKYSKTKIKQVEIKKELGNMPTEVLEDFGRLPKLTEATLKIRFNSIYRKKYNIGIEDVLKAFGVWKNG